MDPNGWFQKGISPNATEIPLYLLYIYILYKLYYMYTHVYIPMNPIPIRCLVSYPMGPSASHDPTGPQGQRWRPRGSGSLGKDTESARGRILVVGFTQYDVYDRIVDGLIDISWNHGDEISEIWIM